MIKSVHEQGRGWYTSSELVRLSQNKKSVSVRAPSWSFIKNPHPYGDHLLTSILMTIKVQTGMKMVKMFEFWNFFFFKCNKKSRGIQWNGLFFNLINLNMLFLASTFVDIYGKVHWKNRFFSSREQCLRQYESNDVFL